MSQNQQQPHDKPKSQPLNKEVPMTTTQDEFFQGLPSNEQFVLKTHKRGKIFFKLGLFMIMTIPPSIYYFKKHQKELYARGIIKDMQRIHEKGRTIHDIPKYETHVSFGKRL
ncbi:hypothetical protein FGO68_gene14508 [Halteria grandinella]|uniref:Uncharacterized protein n=1 Tax=Halteria grandinella TaxID=5974 RepID=A0A8J8NI39_HALGN|nr:hypothetical protein FGO68_gene14508 [Halteria grandinella]